MNELVGELEADTDALTLYYVIRQLKVQRSRGQTKLPKHKEKPHLKPENGC